MRGIVRVVIYDEKGKRLEFKGRSWRAAELKTLKCGCSRIRLTGYRRPPKPHGRNHD